MQRRQREIQQELDQQEESTLEIKGTFSSLQEEVDSKTKKLNRVSAWWYPATFIVSELVLLDQVQAEGLSSRNG